MSWYIGIDGGGTKTAIAIGKENGKILKSIQLTGCSYNEIGAEAVIELISNGVNSILNEVGIKHGDCDGCCIGLPCYGENQAVDKLMNKKLIQALAPIPVYVVNDGVVGWAGSLECGEGIHVVSGTGSIAFGCDKDGKIARSGGWCEFFSDEGSCYWIGRKVLGIFAKQADGRLPKGPLFEQMANDYNISDPFDIIDIVIKNIAPYREKVASLQLKAEKAALAGDASVIALYEKAAEELALLVKSIYDNLSWSKDEVSVSYFGGLFKAGELILKPFENRIRNLGCSLHPPKHTATEGALLLSIHTYKKGE